MPTIFKGILNVFLGLLMLLPISASKVWGQEVDENHRSLHMSLGVSHYRLVDELLAGRSLQFNGNTFSSQLLFEEHSPDHAYAFLLNYGQGNLRNVNAALDAKVHHLRLKGSYQKKIGNYLLFGKDSKLYVGPQLGLSDYVLHNQEVLENVTLTLYNTIDVFLSHQIFLNPKHRLDIHLSLPLAGMIKREDYDGGANTQLEKDFESNILGFLFRGSKATLLNPLHQPSVHLIYKFNPENKISWMLNYQFHFLRNTQHLPIRLYENSIMLGLSF